MLPRRCNMFDHTASYEKPRLLNLGDSAWTIEFGLVANAQNHQRVLAFRDALKAANLIRFGAILDTVPSLRSLSVHYDPLQTDAMALGQFLLELSNGHTASCSNGVDWYLPICFESEYAPDLASISKSCGLSTQQIIELITGISFQVYMLGFLPGFAFLGDLPEVLHLPRLAQPRTKVPAGSVGIAGKMCAAYPWESPGGWNLLGRTPVQFFSSHAPNQPALLNAGDHVHWQAIGADQYIALKSTMQAPNHDHQQWRTQLQNPRAWL
ncbi:MAG TPA: 5-oxoprolinase subunit PxpB [Burkholderiaceae bacterium]|nr:5-oxoprolinase subunit PxpB [Burkholderiaceae bacterium]